MMHDMAMLTFRTLEACGFADAKYVCLRFSQFCDTRYTTKYVLYPIR